MRCHPQKDISHFVRSSKSIQSVPVKSLGVARTVVQFSMCIWEWRKTARLPVTRISGGIRRLQERRAANQAGQRHASPGLLLAVRVNYCPKLPFVILNRTWAVSTGSSQALLMESALSEWVFLTPVGEVIASLSLEGRSNLGPGDHFVVPMESGLLAATG